MTTVVFASILSKIFLLYVILQLIVVLTYLRIYKALSICSLDGLTEN